MQVPSIERPAISGRPWKRMNWRAMAVRGILGAMALMVATVVGVQWTKTSALRDSARLIQLGDERAKVDALLGRSYYGYETGWPSPGAPATVIGDLYGGPLNSMHMEMDSIAARSLRGIPQWYNRFFSSNVKAWPVVVEYNSQGLVTAVSVDGLPIRRATKP